MCFGNSHFHIGAWELLMSFGGDVLLHEVSLCGLYLALDERGLLGEFGVEGRVRSLEGRTLEAALADRCAMTGEIVGAARRVFVHTEPARRLLVQRHPDRADDIAVVSFALPSATARRRPGRAPVVASFGYMRAAGLVIDAFVQLVAAYPRSQLWLVGAELFLGQRDELQASLRAHGLDHSATITGWVSEAEYHRRLATTTIAIQPRTHDFGERSAALGDLLAAGVPTIVSATDSTAAIPADAVIRVDIERGADGLATAAKGLLADRSQQRRLSRNARRYARAHDATRAARELLSGIDAPLSDTRHAGAAR
jgi:glycosyltransferase involved in cell wall biosynthesis